MLQLPQLLYKTFINKVTPPVASVLFTTQWGKTSNPMLDKMQHTQSCHLKTFHYNLLQIALDSSPLGKTDSSFIHIVLALKIEVTAKTT